MIMTRMRMQRMIGVRIRNVDLKGEESRGEDITMMRRRKKKNKLSMMMMKRKSLLCKRRVELLLQSVMIFLMTMMIQSKTLK